MGNENWSAARYWGGTEGADIAGATKALTASVSAITVPTFTTTAARDTAGAAWVAEGSPHTLEGLQCYISGRKANCYNDGVAWRWVTIHNSLYLGTRPAIADSPNNTTPVSILDSGTLTIPAGGNRKIRVVASTNATALTGTGTFDLRMYLTGTNTANSEDWRSQAQVNGAGSQTTLNRSWEMTASGTCTFAIWGTPVGASQAARFAGSFLSVIDMGATDD